MATSPIRILILGASSGIARATARLYAAEGATLVLAGRQPARLEAIAADLRLRGAAAATGVVIDFVADDPASTWAALLAEHGPFDHVLLAYGVLGDQVEAERDPVAAQAILSANFTSAAAWALLVAEAFEARGSGALVVLGSVAGDRGRRANYVYGAAKAGIAVLVQGIDHRFAGRFPKGSGPRAVVVKPGPTDTPMTAGMKKGALMASPEAVAKVVRRAAESGGPVQYAPRYWGMIMRIIRLVPSSIFNKMNL